MRPDVQFYARVLQEIFSPSVLREILTRATGVRKPITVSYMICATPRTGSGLLCEVLRRTGRAGWPGEYFRYWRAARDPGRVVDRQMRRWMLPPEAYVDKAVNRGRAYWNGVLGIKVMGGQLEIAIENLRTLPEYRDLDAKSILGRVFPNLYYIHISRRDKVAQAISLAKAIQSGEWFRYSNRWWTRRGKRTLHYDFHQIAQCHQRILDQEQVWETFFREARIQPYRVVYEEFVESWQKTARDILRYVNVPGCEEITFARIWRKPQSDGFNLEWARRFREESRITLDDRQSVAVS